MNIDAITLAAVADEWRLLLTGARIDTIIQPTEHSIAIQCYAPTSRDQQKLEGAGEKEGRGGQNRWLYLSAHPQIARAHITALKPPKIASEPPPFVMLLRKYLEGTRIEAIEQPRWDRVLHIIAGYRNPESEERVRFKLIIEIMGRLSNIVFCDERGTILGSLKRVGADVNRYRVIIPGVPYMPPPPQQRVLGAATLPRLEPSQVTAAQLSIAAAEDAASTTTEQAAHDGEKRKRKPDRSKLWQLLTRNLLGCSPLLAREAVYRTTEDSEIALKEASDEVWEELAWNMRELAALYDSHQWHPQLIERKTSYSHQAASDAAQKDVPVVAAPYVLEQYASQSDVSVRESPSINVLLDEYFARTEWSDALEGIRGPMRKVLQSQRERCDRKVQLLQQDLAVSEEAAQYRLYGDLLLAHQHEVAQGASSVNLQNYFDGGEEGAEETVAVPLDPRYDAVGNANRLFHKYHKLRRALALVPAQIEQNAAELATVRQLQADLALAETPAEVALVKAEVQAAGYLRGKRQIEERKAQKGKGGKGGKQGKGKPVAPGGGVPLTLQDRSGFSILIGKNSRQNEDVTFHHATSNDIWLHARGVPGAHVIIKSAGRTVPHETIERAASLAAYYSEARGSTNVSVDYTQQRHVRHMKGAGPGMVIYDHERTIYAHPDEAVALLGR
jgi:predicted ribosome quality control (RQC) complex YloA/Tae2 family protein